MSHTVPAVLGILLWVVIVVVICLWIAEATDDGPPELILSPNPDILKTLGTHPLRPRLLVGFAAETSNLLANAAAKRTRKGADWIIANDVSGDVMGGSHNHVHLVYDGGADDLGEAPKEEIAHRLIARIAKELTPE